MAYQNVVVVGAGGKLGAPLVERLITSTEPKFQITALVRPTSSYSAPEEVDTTSLTVVKVDFTDHAALVKALTGQDAVILTITAMNPELKPASISVIDASVEAGVKWIMPSDFGTDESPLTTFLFATKREIHDHLMGKVNQDVITYNAIRNGPWFDTGLETALAFNIKEHRAIIYKDHRKFYSTTRASICTAIVNVLSEPFKFKNKILHIHDFFINQSELLEVVENVMGEKFSVDVVDVEELGKKAMENLKRGQATKMDGWDLAKWSIWGEDTSCRWDPNDDSEALGLGGVSFKEEVEKYVVSVKI